MIPDNHLEFLQAVWIRRPFFTYVFFGLNIIIFILMTLAGASDAQTLLAFGAKDNFLIANGQWWRFITPIFIHIGLLHLAFNSYALWMVGPQVEKLYGRAKFVILYVLTGIGGVVGSYLYHPEYKSAGASGAIFGLFGVLLVFGIRYRHSIPPEFKRAVGTGVLPVILINLIIGFSITAIDNSAHIGGLLVGALLAAVVPFEKPNEETSNAFKLVQTVLLALIAVSFFLVAKNYDGPHLSVRNIGRSLSFLPTANSAADEFVDTLNDSRKTFELSVDILGSGRKDQLTYLKRDLGKSMDRLRKMPSLDAKSDQLSSSLAKVLQDQYELAENMERSGTVTFGHTLQLKENVRAYRDVMMEFSEWIQNNGSKFGIQMRQGTVG